MMHIRIVAVVLMFFRFASAQPVAVSANVDSSSIEIGDWIRYTVSVTHPASVTISFPSLKDSIGSFEIIRQDSLMRSEEKGEVSLSKQFVISKYTAGTFEVQPFVVRYRDANGDTGIAVSNPIPVEVRGIEVDTSGTIRDLKPPLTVPVSLEEIALYAGIAAGVAALIYAAYYYGKKRKRKGETKAEEELPQIPPHVLALMQLEELEKKKLWQSGQIKLYYSEATEIIRRYVEQRYGVMALEMTTGEVMEQLATRPIGEPVRNNIEQLLSGADLVKFAKYQPVAAENEEVISRARSIVEQTAPKPSESDGGNNHTAMKDLEKKANV